MDRYCEQFNKSPIIAVSTQYLTLINDLFRRNRCSGTRSWGSLVLNQALKYIETVPLNFWRFSNLSSSNLKVAYARSSYIQPKQYGRCIIHDVELHRSPHRQFGIDYKKASIWLYSALSGTQNIQDKTNESSISDEFLLDIHRAGKWHYFEKQGWKWIK